MKAQRTTIEVPCDICGGPATLIVPDDMEDWRACDRHYREWIMQDIDEFRFNIRLLKK